MMENVAKTVEKGYDNAKSDVLSRKGLDNREMPGLTAVLQNLQGLKIKPEMG
jgi:hypothetical protein